VAPGPVDGVCTGPRYVGLGVGTVPEGLGEPEGIGEPEGLSEDVAPRTDVPGVGLAVDWAVGLGVSVALEQAHRKTTNRPTMTVPAPVRRVRI
jgi:hypothetical protein